MKFLVTLVIRTLDRFSSSQNTALVIAPLIKPRIRLSATWLSNGITGKPWKRQAIRYGWNAPPS